MSVLQKAISFAGILIISVLAPFVLTQPNSQSTTASACIVGTCDYLGKSDGTCFEYPTDWCDTCAGPYVEHARCRDEARS